MVTPVEILGFRMVKSPRDLALQAYSIPVVVAAGATRVISPPNEFLAMGVSVAIQNTDAAAVATAILNNDRINIFNVINGSPVSLSGQWIAQLEITAAPGGQTIVLFEVIPLADIT